MNQRTHLGQFVAALNDVHDLSVKQFLDLTDRGVKELLQLAAIN